jgi:8-oxo-dGTP diphosphatase
MAIPQHVRKLRSLVGNDLLMLPSVSAVVVNDAGQVLLGRRADDGQWALIAGIMEPGEQPADAAVREVLEETGVHVKIERLAGVALHPVTYPNGDACDYLNVWFLCRATGGEARVNDDESLEVGWFDQDALPTEHPWDALRIRTALDPLGEPWFSPAGAPVPAELVRP